MDTEYKEIGRINIDVEKKLKIDLEGDTKIYITDEEESILKEKYVQNYDRLLEEFRAILKKPNFVRMSDNSTDFIYISLIIRNSTISPYRIHFSKEKDKFILRDFGYYSSNDIKLLDSLFPFVKIN